MEGCPSLPWLSKAIFNRSNGQVWVEGESDYLDLWYAKCKPNPTNVAKKESFDGKKQETPEVFPLCL